MAKRTTSARNWNVNVRYANHHFHRHFHQLLRHLRHDGFEHQLEADPCAAPTAPVAEPQQEVAGALQLRAHHTRRPKAGSTRWLPLWGEESSRSWWLSSGSVERHSPTLSKEWWVTVARTAAIDCCSCLSHERSRRSLQRRALPVPPSAPSRAAMGLPRGFD